MPLSHEPREKDRQNPNSDKKGSALLSVSFFFCSSLNLALCSDCEVRSYGLHFELSAAKATTTPHQSAT